MSRVSWVEAEFGGCMECPSSKTSDRIVRVEVPLMEGFLATLRLCQEHAQELSQKLLNQFTDDQRLEVFVAYCKECGCEQGDGFCQCWNDE